MKKNKLKAIIAIIIGILALAYIFSPNRPKIDVNNGSDGINVHMERKANP